MAIDHVKMLCDIGELNSLFINTKNIEAFLQQIADMVANHMMVDVCSIYLFDEKKEELVLKATKGLNPDSVDKVRLMAGEGLVGLALKQMRPVCEKVGKDNPNFKFFPGIFEEQYECFLVVPILRGHFKVGALVIQRGRNCSFQEQDIMALKAIASQLVTMIENARILMNVPVQREQKNKEEVVKTLTFLKGKVGAEGFAFAPAIVIDEKESFAHLRQQKFEKRYSLADFERALVLTEKQLQELQRRVEEKLSDAASLIFSAHLLMMKDIQFIGKIKKLIQEGANPPEAILKISKEYQDIFSEIPNPLLQEKVHDIVDLTKRMIKNMTLAGLSSFSSYEGYIVITKEILPSDLLKLSVEKISGLILVSGGVTSHLSILARSLQIPLIIVDILQLLNLPQKTKLLMDAELGNVYINPSKEIIFNFENRNKAREHLVSHREIMSSPTKTRDGISIKLMANINLLTDLKQLKNDSVDGIGLYRTEFPFLIRNTFPSEEEQFVIYRKLVDGVKNKPITFRTLDIGGDKIFSYYNEIKEQNPFLGMRSIRFSFKHKDIFKQQIRAILKAGAGADIRIMFPMISSIDEFLAAKKIVLACMKNLKEEKTELCENPQIGAMIEIPSLLNILDELCKESDFFSVGTNDLIQYTLAADRTNEKVADWYIPHHPSILRFLTKIATVANSQGKEVSVCGDMAHEKKYIPFLLGIGIHALSIDPIYITKVKKIISKIHIDKAKEMAIQLLAKSRVNEINQILN